MRTLHRILGALFLITFWLVLPFVLVGCQNKGAAASGIVAQQTPGQSSGAGATFTGPANSAAPSTQVAQRRAAYYPAPVRQWPLPTTGLAATTPGAAPVLAPDSAPSSQLSALSSQLPPAPVWIDEKTETTFGQHQDAAALVQAATALGSWGKARWVGVLCVLFAAFGLAWSHNNPDGYPLVCWKFGGAGLVLAIFDPSPWWLLLLIIPGLFFVAQKFNLLRLP